MENTLNVPHNVYIILTSRCNLRCVHCYGNYGECNNSELTGEEWDCVIKDLAKHKVFYLNISGGEPTCHKDFCKIIDSLIKYDFPFILTTNGFFSNDILQKIIQAKSIILGIKISLDGYDNASHEYIRKTANKTSADIFGVTLHNIKELIQNKINVSIATCLHKANVKNFIKMKNLILDLQPSSWYVSTISLSGRAIHNTDIFVSEKVHSKKYWLNIKSECEAKNIQVRYIDMPNVEKSSKRKNIYFSCPAAKWFCEINSDGLVTPCPLSRVFINEKFLKFENIKDKNIKEIWNSTTFETFRKWQHMGCEGCKVVDKCERCVPQSIQWLSDPLSPPPYCIKNGKLLGLKNLKELNNKLNQKFISTNRGDYV